MKTYQIFLLLAAVMLLLASCKWRTPVKFTVVRPSQLLIDDSHPTKNVLTWAEFEGAEFYEIQARFKGSKSDKPTEWLTLRQMHPHNTFEQTDVRPGVIYEYRILPLSGQLQVLGTWSHTVSRTVPE